MTSDRNRDRARDFFNRVAHPLYQRHQVDGESEELLWAAVAALNHIGDYYGLRTQHPDIDVLRAIANALKHGKPARQGKVAHVEPHTLDDDVWAVPDIWEEPNIFSVWVIEIDGKTCSIGLVLKSAVDFWMNELQTG
jgi:hypothetical protein